MIGLVSVFDKNDTMLDIFQMEFSNCDKKKYSDIMALIQKSEPDIRKHIIDDLVKKYPTDIYWICNIFSDMMNYLYCFDNDV